MSFPFDEDRLQDGFRYDAYRSHWQAEKDAPLHDPDPSERKMHHFLNYNWERQSAVHEAYEPSDEVRAAVTSIQAPQVWMVLTEPWCGDSAFLLPVIAEAARLNDDIELRILLRDENLDIMDQYLTDGSRSIPRLVAFSADGEERFVWGPRPEGARRRFEELKEEHDEKMAAIEGLVAYYEDGAWREADGELAAALRRVSPTPDE